MEETSIDLSLPYWSTEIRVVCSQLQVVDFGVSKAGEFENKFKVFKAIEPVTDNNT